MGTRMETRPLCGRRNCLTGCFSWALPRYLCLIFCRRPHARPDIKATLRKQLAALAGESRLLDTREFDLKRQRDQLNMRVVSRTKSAKRLESKIVSQMEYSTST